MRISACMIVKNEEKMLEKTLPLLSRYVDEIILVDTGSSDKTIQVAQKYGAKIYHFAWINDFAAARNQSLEHATGDWILWIDADEFIQEEDLKNLRKILEGSTDKAYAFTLYESKPGLCEKKLSYNRVKVFKKGLGGHFVRPINEQLVDSKGKEVKGKEIPVSIYHWGRNLEEERMNAKRLRYIDLYSRALEKYPEDAYLNFLLANNLCELKRNTEALEHYARAFELAPDKEVGRRALGKKANILFRMKKIREAAETAQKLLEIDPQNIPARNVFASLYLVAGKIDNAIGLLSEALKIKVDGGYENLYQTRGMPNYLLGMAYKLKGDADRSRAYFERAREICPSISMG